MQSHKFSIRLAAVLAIFVAAAMMTGTPVFAQQERVLHSFNNDGKDGYAPYAGLIADAAGSLYGTTHGGGAYGAGTAFKLSPQAGGGWKETVLYSFGNSGDGVFPAGGLILDASGNLYGTTDSGGASGGGIAYELSPAGGAWTETVLHAFGSGTDGNTPNGSVVFDGARNLYGTTAYGGTGDCGGSVCGTVYELSPVQGGSWTEKVLYNFDFNANGFLPVGGVIFDRAGNLYGATLYGGSVGNGTVFQLKPGSGGNWTESAIYAFGNIPDGFDPNGSLIFDASGNLYGVTYIGGSGTTCGSSGCGTVFELSRRNGGWVEKILHNFSEDGTDGYLPIGSLVLDAAGHLYGVTERGGKNTNCPDGSSCGAVLELGKSGGRWAERVVHSFSLNGTDGVVPQSNLIFDKAGNLYGTTLGGGAHNAGTVFEIKP